ncbi:MAG: hypothetical protein AAGC55_00560 [Myxococcota bacterium]
MWFVAASLVALTCSACDLSGELGPDGPAGPTGPTGPAGPQGPAASCAATALPLVGEFYPEGVAIGADGTLYSASFASGEIVRLSACAPEPETFAVAGPLGPTGLLVDDQAGLLWACVSDLGGAAPAAMVAYDLDSGDEQWRYAVAANGWCGDMAQADDGTLYVTDPILGLIYRVAAAERLEPPTAEGGAMAIWTDDPALASGVGGFGLNGLAVTGDGVYVVHNDGLLRRVAMTEDDSAGAVVAIDLGRPLLGPDGLEAVGDNRLVVVENASGEVSVIELGGVDSGALRLMANNLAFPTTIAIRERTGWIAEGQLDHLLGLDPSPPELPFRLVRITLP